MSVIFYYKGLGQKVRFDDVDHVWGGDEIVVIRGTEEVYRTSVFNLVSYEVWTPRAIPFQVTL